MAQLQFNAATVAPDTGFDTVPKGWYIVALDESEFKPTKAGDGSYYLKATFKILEGKYAGRKIFNNFNLKNANPTTQEIAWKQLSALCHAVGVLQMNDTQELHGKPLKVKVAVRSDKSGEYDDQNDIKSYKNINEDVGPTGGDAGPATGAGGFPGAGAAGGFPAQQQFQAQPQQQFQPQAQPQGTQSWQQPAGNQPWQNGGNPGAGPMGNGTPPQPQETQQFVQQQPNQQQQFQPQQQFQQQGQPQNFGQPPQFQQQGAQGQQPQAQPQGQQFQQPQGQMQPQQFQQQQQFDPAQQQQQQVVQQGQSQMPPWAAQ